MEVVINRSVGAGTSAAHNPASPSANYCSVNYGVKYPG